MEAFASAELFRETWISVYEMAFRIRKIVLVELS